MSAKHVELLVVDGCPNVDATLDRVRTAIGETGIGASVQIVPIENDDQAKHLKFLGSPTVRIDGVDVDPSAASRDDYGLQCRVYNVRGRLEGAPPMAWILSALGVIGKRT